MLFRWLGWGVGAFSSEILHSNSHYFILIKSSRKFFFIKIDVSVSLSEVFTYQERQSPLGMRLFYIPFQMHVVIQTLIPGKNMYSDYHSFYRWVQSWCNAKAPRVGLQWYLQQVVLSTYPWTRYFLIFWRFGVFFLCIWWSLQ